MGKQGSSEFPETTDAGLPSAAGGIAEQQPELWRAYQELGAAAAVAGPLESRTRRLIHLALAIGAASEGATHSHTRRALAEGLIVEELDHVALLAVTTLGWPQAIRGLCWIRDVSSGQQSLTVHDQLE